MRALLGLLLLFGCGGDESYMIVTVDRRPAVHDAVSLKVTLSNAGSMRTDDLAIGGNEFPLTFSVSAPGRTGELGISIDALDSFGRLVGRGFGATTLTEETASVMLDTADFVVNTTPANNQFLSNDFEAVGLQLATTSDGTWMAAFREDCTACNILGRRFNALGLPVVSTVAASDLQFPVSTSLTTQGSIPAVAGGLGASGALTLVFWDYFETVGSGQGVACRALNDQGAATTGQLSLATDSSDVVTATGLSNGNFVVTWQTFMTTQVIRAVVVTPSCTTLQSMSPFTVSNTAASARRSHVTSNGSTVLYAWIVDFEVRVRTGPLAGQPLGPESTAVPKTATQRIDHVRVSPWGSGFALAARWSTTSGSGPGKIEVYRLSSTGQVMGTPTLITDQSGSDFASNKAFGIAERSDGALLVVWHMCATGPGSCDVYGRILRPTGVPVGEAKIITTATGSDQVNPSVVALNSTSFVAAWNDSSGLDPDTSGSAVRARILYPLYDDARGILGATCGPSAPGAPDCNENLACAMGSDTVFRCFEECTPPSCPGGGTCTTVDAGRSACVF